VKRVYEYRSGLPCEAIYFDVTIGAGYLNSGFPIEEVVAFRKVYDFTRTAIDTCADGLEKGAFYQEELSTVRQLDENLKRVVTTGQPLYDKLAGYPSSARLLALEEAAARHFAPEIFAAQRRLTESGIMRDHLALVRARDAGTAGEVQQPRLGAS